MSEPDGFDLYTFDAELYDHVVPYRERQDIGFFVDAAAESGGPVLEIGCGTGRVLIPTARAGIEITGLDMSTHMLAVCRQQAGGRARPRCSPGCSWCRPICAVLNSPNPSAW